jgi:hypothetical protein
MDYQGLTLINAIHEYEGTSFHHFVTDTLTLILITSHYAIDDEHIYVT